MWKMGKENDSREELTVGIKMINFISFFRRPNKKKGFYAA